MEVELKRVTIDEKEVLKNLLEKHSYEFSQYTRAEVNKDGLFGYTYLDNYWNEENRFAYFILVDNKLAGFVMIHQHAAISNRWCDYQMAEFFVIYRYRRLGVGSLAVKRVWEMHSGKWQLRYHPHNMTSKLFWHQQVKKITNNCYKCIEDSEEAMYEDRTIGSVLVFEVDSIT